MTNKYAIFLDHDGVLCNTRTQLGHTCEKHVMWDKFDPVAIDFLNWIDAHYNVDFVLCTTWKNHIRKDDSMYFHWINSAYRNSGFRGRFPYPNWKTNPDNNLDKYNKMNGRAHEIKDYLNDFGPYDDFIIFDDSDFEYNKVLGIKRFVKTSSEDGILTKHMLNAKSLMGNWIKNV